MTERDPAAAALAAAFLDGDWDVDAMARRGRRAVGDRRRWVHRLAHAVVVGFPEAPADRPRELAAFIAACPPYRDLVRAARRNQRTRPEPPRARHHPPVPTRMAAKRWDVPDVPTVGALAERLGLDAGELDWFADPKLLGRRAADERLRHYTYAWVPTRDAFRLLEAPKQRLKELQRRILAHVLEPIPPDDAAHGFRRGRSVVSYAAPHAGRAVVVHLDLAGFFAAVTAGRVYGILRTAGYPQPVAHALAGLLTTASPVAVLRAAPPAAAQSLLRALAAPHLAQGAPTSPALANLAAYRLDRRLTGLAAAVGGTYTRYADDLAFSGSARLPVGLLVRQAGVIAAAEGFRLNPAKTSVARRDDRQLLGGLVVNARPAVPRPEYDRLRAVLHDAVHHGPAAANRYGVADFRAHLLGRIAWVAHTSPARGAPLRAAFDRISW